jgi:hypothetical protein
MKPKNIFSGTIHILLNAKAMERKVITVPWSVNGRIYNAQKDI